MKTKGSKQNQITMNISAKVEYACVAMIELATCFDHGKTVCLREIADRHGIPAKFLVQIMLQLKAANLVSSTRGASGGYRLQVEPDKVTLLEVMEVIEGSQQTLQSNISKSSTISQSLMQNWQQIQDQQHDVLANITLAQLAQQANQSLEAMYYI